MKTSSTLSDHQPSLLRRIAVESFLVLGVTAFLALFLRVIHPHYGLLALYIPFIYYLFAIHNYCLLELLHKKRINLAAYIFLTFLTTAIGFIPFLLLITKLHGRYSQKIILIAFPQVLIIIGFTYYYFFKQKNSSQTIANLQKDLGKTTAEMKLIQSQINPHFLFNVMNSIYGIALQEQADRTANSIQRLSQMMRFMLFENQQDYILLARDLDYLREYIAIQSLRVENVPSIKIESEVIDPTENFYISPMLLIPFVENAFKHGISMDAPSWIKISTDIQNQQLKFSVYNSIHYQEGTDLERTKSGIGLDNVQTRLRIYYPGKHLLVIEQNQQEFFVFLTLDLIQGQPEEANSPTNS